MGAIENVKEVAKLVKDLGNMELYQQILDLQGEIMDLTQVNREFQKQVQELQEKLTQVGQMTFRSPFYFQNGDDVPYCPRCWEADKRAIHYPEPFRAVAGPIYTCPQCKHDIVHPRRQRP